MITSRNNIRLSLLSYKEVYHKPRPSSHLTEQSPKTSGLKDGDANILHPIYSHSYYSFTFLDTMILKCDALPLCWSPTTIIEYPSVTVKPAYSTSSAKTYLTTR